MPPGKYKVAVEHLKGRNDILKGAFSEERTPFVCEVKTADDEVTIDLDSTTLTLPTGERVQFPIEAFSRYCLLNGTDELGFLLGRMPEIKAYEQPV